MTSSPRPRLTVLPGGRATPPAVVPETSAFAPWIVTSAALAQRSGEALATLLRRLAPHLPCPEVLLLIAADRLATQTRDAGLACWVTEHGLRWTQRDTLAHNVLREVVTRLEQER